MAKRQSSAPKTPVGPWPHHDAEIGREGEERAGHGLGRAIAREKHVVRHPTVRDDLGLEQRQDDMAAAEDERARAIEGIDEPHGLASRQLARSGRPINKAKKRRSDVSATARARRRAAALLSRRGAIAARSARPTAAPRTIAPSCPTVVGRSSASAAARPRASLDFCRGERARHLQHGERDHRDSRDFQAMDRARAGRIAERADTEAEEHQKQIADGVVKPVQAASAPRYPALDSPMAMPTWLDEGPGRNWQSATRSA